MVKTSHSRHAYWQSRASSCGRHGTFSRLAIYSYHLAPPPDWPKHKKTPFVNQKINICRAGEESRSRPTSGEVHVQSFSPGAGADIWAKRSVCISQRPPFVLFCGEAKGMLWHGAAGPEDLFREVKDDLTHVILGRAFGCCDDD